MKDIIKIWTKGWIECLVRVTVYWWTCGVALVLLVLGYFKGVYLYDELKEKLGRK